MISSNTDSCSVYWKSSYRKSSPWRSHRALAAALVIASFSLIARPALAISSASGIDSISPAAARKGETVTIAGRGFGALNVQVTVGGVPAQVLVADGNQVRFRVPAGVKPGMTEVIATNPGFRSGSIGFRMLEGILLPGDASALIKDATLNLPPVGVDASQILDGIFLTRLEVRFALDATVGQVNDALRQIESGIVSMSRGFSSMTIAVPRQENRAALENLIALLETLPGVRLAKLAQSLQAQQIFTPADFEDVVQIRHLLPSRFPAAWNALPPGVVAGSGSCPVAPIPVLIADFFSATAPAGFSDNVPGFPAPPSPGAGFPADVLAHGYAVSTILAASGVGANPFLSTGCLSLRPIQQASVAPNQATDSIVAGMPSGKFIVNYSVGFVGSCTGTDETPGSPCVPPSDRLRPSKERADDALYWKEQTKGRWGDFLMVVAGGNDRDKESTLIYPGMGDSRFGSEMAISQLNDTLFNFVREDPDPAAPRRWTPSPVFAAAGFVPLVPTDSERAALIQSIADAGMAGTDAIADNVIVVGSATTESKDGTLTQHVAPEQLAESLFSNNGPDVLAVGEDVFDQDGFTGTSFAAPQVAGLASYLWMLAPALTTDQPVSVTKRAIVANTRNKVIDAYASVLSLDPAELPTADQAKIRLNILDVTGDGGFNERDLDDFLRHFFVVAPDGTITRQAAPGTTADFSRYDLNGDGFTTAGARRERFDLDRVGSTQFGATVYSVVSENIEGQEIHFDETAVTDLEILCYYAYSAMYQGDPDVRKSLLAGRCGISVQPATATVHSGQQQQFTANVPGGDAVTWTVTGGGTIDSKNGLFTAGNTAGTFTVRATDNNDSNQFGEASVTVAVANTSCDGLTFFKELRLGNHLLSQDFLLDSQPGAINQTLPSAIGFSSGNVDIGSISLTAEDPDTQKDVELNGRVTGVQAIASTSDELVLTASDPALQGTGVTFSVSVKVTATIEVTGDHAFALWGLFGGASGLDVQGRASTIAGQSNGDPSGGTYTGSGFVARLGSPVVIGFLFDAVAGVDRSPTEPFPPLTFGGSARAQVSLQVIGVSNVRDRNGNPVKVSVCSASGTNWGTP